MQHANLLATLWHGEKAHSGIAIMMYLPRDVATQLALPEGEPVADLHLTLSFLGDKVDLPDDTGERVARVLAEFGAVHTPLEGSISGIGRFNASETSDGKDVIYASYDAPGLPALREALLAALAEAGLQWRQDHGFTPHITLAYVDPAAVVDLKLATVPLTLDSITLAVGDEHQRFSLGAEGAKEEPMDKLTNIKELSLDQLRGAIQATLDQRGIPPAPARGPNDLGYRWIRELYADRAILEVDPGPGSAQLRYYSVPYTVGLNDEIILGEPVQVEMTYTPVSVTKEADDKATWDTAYVNSLPDSCFLFVEPGDKDEEGKTTPRSKRHFPYRDADNKVDLPHLRNAIARIPQSNAPGLDDEKKQALQGKARRMLEEASGEKAGKRMGQRMKDKLKSIMDTMRDMMSWADYQDGDGEPEPTAGKTKDHGFKLYRDKAGRARWVCWTSNAFTDREGEIFATKALEDDVGRTDANWPEAERQLLLWHIPGSDFGRADWAGIVGRMLVESGTFLDTPRGQKALAYFQTHPDAGVKMSHGYEYRKGDRADGVYDWMHRVERSVLPAAAAANPWTKFSLKEETMPLTEAKRKALEEMFGADEAATIVAAAEQKTKELEEKGIAFKDQQQKPEPTPSSPDNTPIVLDDKALADLAVALVASPALADLVTGQKAASESLTKLQADLAAMTTMANKAVADTAALLKRIEAVEKADADKVAETVKSLPRFVIQPRATQNPTNALDPKDTKDAALLATAAGGVAEQNPNHPLNNPLR